MTSSEGLLSLTAAAGLTVVAMRGHSADITVLKLRGSLRHFGAWAGNCGISNLQEVTPLAAMQYVLSPLPDGQSPQTSTCYGRRAAIRVLFRQVRDLGHDVGDPTLDLRLPSRPSNVARPLLDEELLLCRHGAVRRSQRGGGCADAVLALAESTAVTSEIPQVRILDLDDLSRPRYVRLAGTSKHDARDGALTDWGSAVLAARAARRLSEPGAAPGDALAYEGRHPHNSAAAQSAASTSLRQVLTAVGLSDDASVKPGSVRHWAGRSLLDNGLPIEAVALRMGMRSLDATAEDIGLEWRPCKA